MPIECNMLLIQECLVTMCEHCGTMYPNFLRGQVQRPKRFLGFLWKRDYCAVICHNCKRITGWESPNKTLMKIFDDEINPQK